mgnify:CR=1 FL=1
MEIPAVLLQPLKPRLCLWRPSKAKPINLILWCRLALSPRKYHHCFHPLLIGNMGMKKNLLKITSEAIIIRSNFPPFFKDRQLILRIDRRHSSHHTGYSRNLSQPVTKLSIFRAKQKGAGNLKLNEDTLGKDCHYEKETRIIKVGMFVIYYRPGGNSVMCHFCCKTYKQLAALRRHCKEKHGVLAWIKEQQIFYEAHQKAKSEYYVCIEDREGAAAPSCHLLSSLHSLLLITFSIVDGCLYTVCSNKSLSLRGTKLVEITFTMYLCVYPIYWWTDQFTFLTSSDHLMCQPK